MNRVRRQNVYKFFYGIGLWSLVTAGCAPETAPDPFLQESPFLDLQTPEDKVVVTCYFLPVEIGGSVEGLDDLLVKCTWDAKDMARVFSPAMIQQWQDNGFMLAVASVTKWGELIDGLRQKGGRMLPGRTALFQHPSQVAEFPLMRIPREQSLFVFQSRRLRGYQVQPGQVFFRVNCVPAGEDPHEGVHVKLAPILLSDAKQFIVPDDVHRWEDMYRQTEIVFHELILEGTVPLGSMILIAPAPAAGKGLWPGPLFMARMAGADNIQWLTIVAPQVQTARQIKEQEAPPKANFNPQRSEHP